MSSPQRRAEKRRQQEADDLRREQEQREDALRRDRLIANIAAELDSTSLPEVLAEILLDPKGFLERNYL